MKNKPRVLTILSGVISILMGVFITIISAYTLLFSLDQYNPWLLVITFGLVILFQIVLFLIALSAGVVFVVFGATEIRIGTLPDYKYARRGGQIITYSVLNIIAAIIGIVVMVTSSTSLVMAAGSVILGVSLICALFKILDYILFKKKVNKGLISIENPNVIEIKSKKAPVEEVIVTSEPIPEKKDKKKSTTKVKKDNKNEVL